MIENRKKRPRDPNQLAKLIVDIATGEEEDRSPTPEEEGKDPHAVELGRKGGRKGGKARAEKLRDEKRQEIARSAARARRSEERRVGKESVSTCRSRGSQYHKKKNTNNEEKQSPYN